MSSRNQTPVNLKERIAALEAQRSSSSTPSSSSSNPAHNANSPGQLKAKIEKFEKKGGVPVPRGRFGLGVPPPVEAQLGVKRGELYGNRIPAVRSVSVNVTGSSTGTSRTFEGAGTDAQRRVVSLSSGPMLDDDDASSSAYPFSLAPDSPPGDDSLRPHMTGTRSPSPSSLYESQSQQQSQFVKTHTTGGTFQPSVVPLKPHITGGAPPLTRRGTEFAAALEKARKLELEALKPAHTGGDGEAIKPAHTGERQGSVGPAPTIAPAVVAEGTFTDEQESQSPASLPASSPGTPATPDSTPSPFQAPFVPSIVVSRDASAIAGLAPEAGSVPGTADDGKQELLQQEEKVTAEEKVAEAEMANAPTSSETATPSDRVSMDTVRPSPPSSPSPTPSPAPATPSEAAAPADESFRDSFRESFRDDSFRGDSFRDSFRAPAIPPTPTESPAAATTFQPQTPTISVSRPPAISPLSPSVSSPSDVGEGEEPPRTSISEVRAVVDQALAHMQSVTPLSAGFSLGSASSAGSGPVVHSAGTEGGVESASASPLPTPAKDVKDEEQVEEVKSTPVQTIRPLPAVPSPPRPLPIPKVTMASAAPEKNAVSGTSEQHDPNALSPSVDSKHASTVSTSSTHRKELYLDLTVPSPLSASYPRSALASSDIEGDYGVGVGDLRAAALSSRPAPELSPEDILSPELDPSDESDPNVLEILAEASVLQTLPVTPENQTFLSTSASQHSTPGRPVSMYEMMSPSKIEVATRHTPATSRGVPVFVPSSAKTRKSDFVYFPPTPGRDRFDDEGGENEKMSEKEKEEIEADMKKAQEEMVAMEKMIREREEEGVSIRPKGPMRSATVHTSHKPSGSYSMPSRYLAHYVGDEHDTEAPPPPSATTKPTFTAIVHRKKRTVPDITATAASRSSISSAGHGPPPASASAAVPLPERKPEPQRRLPETPSTQRIVHVEVPATPGNADLAALLQKAVLLEDTLSKGELPGETPAPPTRVIPRPLDLEHPEVLQPRRRPSEDLPQTQAQIQARQRRERERERKEEELDAKAAAWAREQHIDSADDVFTSPPAAAGAKLRHTFLIPLSKAKTLHKKEGSNATVDSAPVAIPPRPKSVFGTEKELPNPHEGRKSETVDELGYLPQKKSPRSRFPSFKRIASGKYASTSGANVRHSNSTSSELSVDEAVTPPDPSGEFGSDVGHASSVGHGSTHSGMTWPTLSPKKSHGSIGLGGRASSFAEKMWGRTRTKSTTSTLSALSAYDNSVDRIESIPESLAVGQRSTLPPLPPIPPDFEDQGVRIIVPPARSTSLQNPHARSQHHSSETLSPHSDVSSASSTSTYGRLPSPQLPPLPQNESLLSIVDDPRPQSWMSVASSVGSLPSPLLPQDLYDAFPSVPQGTPVPPVSRDPRSAMKPSFDHDLLLSANELPSASVTELHSPPLMSGLPPVSAMTPSFDQELLSSAVHLKGDGMRSATHPSRKS